MKNRTILVIIGIWAAFSVYAEELTIEADVTVSNLMSLGSVEANLFIGDGSALTNVGIGVEADPTVPASIKDGIDWTELSGVPSVIIDHGEDSDASVSNEWVQNLTFTPSNQVLELVDAGGNFTADLSSLVDVETDPVWGTEKTNYLTIALNDLRFVNLTGDTMVGDLMIRANLVVGSGTATGLYAMAQGNATTASGYASHAEGGVTTSSGNYSHAEGRLTSASGVQSHAEGDLTEAVGISSHAEGQFTKAFGKASHAAGKNAVASNDYTYVWSDGTEISSTAMKQYTVYAENGIRLLGGPISGDGSALTNLNALMVETDPDWTGASGTVYSAILLKQDASTAATDAKRCQKGVEKGVSEHIRTFYEVLFSSFWSQHSLHLLFFGTPGLRSHDCPLLAGRQSTQVPWASFCATTRLSVLC